MKGRGREVERPLEEGGRGGRNRGGGGGGSYSDASKVEKPSGRPPPSAGFENLSLLPPSLPKGIFWCCLEGRSPWALFQPPACGGTICMSDG